MLEFMTLPSNCWHPPLDRGTPKIERPRSTRKTSPTIPMAADGNSSVSRRHKVTVACAACKARKSRCTGTSPCEACVSLNTDCVIDETLDGRRKVALNRRLDELVHHKWILEGLLLSLRTSRDAPLLNILDLVNGQAPLPVLAASISDALLKSPDLSNQGGLQPFMMEQANRRSPQNPGRTRSKHTEAWSTTSNDYIDHITLSQKLDNYARQNPVSTGIREPWRKSSGHSSGAVQKFIFDSDPSMPYPFDSGKPYGGSAVPTDEVGLDDVVVWLKTVAVQNEAKASVHDAHNYGLPYRGPQQASWHSVMNTEPVGMPTPRLSPGTHLQTPKPSNSSGTETRKKRPLSTMVVPNRPSPHSSFSSSASSSMNIPATTGPLLDGGSLSAPGSATVSFATDCPWNPPPTQGHLNLPRSEADDAPMPKAISSYLSLARSMLSEGVPLQSVFGPDRPLLDLYFRERVDADSHSVCNFASELVGGVKGLEMQAGLALAHMFTYLMRWMVLASAGNYAKIPDMYRPTISQTTTPHSSVVEFCPLPELRDALCRRPRDFMGVLASNLSCNWHFDPATCCETDPQTGSVWLTDAFRAHIENPDNWTCRPEIFKIFPECVGITRTYV